MIKYFRQECIVSGILNLEWYANILTEKKRFASLSSQCANVSVCFFQSVCICIYKLVSFRVCTPSSCIFFYDPVHYFALLQEPRLPSIVETKSDASDDSFHLSPATRSRRNLLLPNFSSPVRRTSLGNLLGDELRQFNALRHCRSPSLSRGVHGQTMSPQPPPKKDHSNPTVTPASTSGQTESRVEQKPKKLLIPTVTCFGPPDLSPR